MLSTSAWTEFSNMGLFANMLFILLSFDQLCEEGLLITGVGSVRNKGGLE